MTIVLNGTTGVTTPDVTSDSYTGPISVSSAAPDNSVKVDASGNLGLGVTPSAWGGTYKAMQIGGMSLMASTAAFDYATVAANASFTSPNWLYTSSDNATKYTQTAGAHQWFTAPSGTAGNAISFTQAMTLDSSGRLLLNTTSALESASILNVNGGSNFCIVTSRDSTGTVSHLGFKNPNGYVGYIQTSGSSTIYATSSDYRLKENIAPMANALAVVQQLKPVTYNWKADGSAGQGFIAHELQAVVPDCVTGEKDAVDAEGNPVYQGIDTSFLVATLTAAIQEQQAIINAQAATITSMQADIAALKAKVGI